MYKNTVFSKNPIKSFLKKVRGDISTRHWPTYGLRFAKNGASGIMRSADVASCAFNSFFKVKLTQNV